MASYVGSNGYYMGCNGPSLTDGAGANSAIESWGADSVDWIRPAQLQSQCKTNIHVKNQDIKTVIDQLQTCYDTVQGYGSAFTKDTSLSDAIGVLNNIKTRLSNLGPVRLDTYVTQYNNNIEYYRVKKIHEEMQAAVHDYNYGANNNITRYSNNWYYNNPYNEDYYSSTQAWENAHVNDVYWYKQNYYPSYPIRNCDHNETTLEALKNCQTLRKINTQGYCIVFEDRPSDSYG